MMMGDRPVKFVFACALVLILAGCTGRSRIESISPLPLSSPRTNAALFDALTIRGTDLPNDWDMGGIRPEDEAGADVRFYYYYNTSAQDLMWVSFSEELAIYLTKESAAQSFEGWSQKNIPPAYADRWKTTPELEFDDHADQRKIACLPGKIDQISYSACVAVARYKNIIVVVRGNVFGNQWLTMSDYRSILEAIDRRFTTTLLKE
jgi:hypothetical protein